MRGILIYAAAAAKRRKAIIVFYAGKVLLMFGIVTFLFPGMGVGGFGIRPFTISLTLLCKSELEAHSCAQNITHHLGVWKCRDLFTNTYAKPYIPMGKCGHPSARVTKCRATSPKKQPILLTNAWTS